jgi:predicted DsbA family dithiol-disulfide isomerase
MDARRTVLYWYDLACPFCYVGQHRNDILVGHGLRLIELPFRAHPEIPAGGILAGPRTAPMYAILEREAQEAGLPLHWPPRLPDTQRALAAAEWTRQHQPRAFPPLQQGLFAAHFARGEDLEDLAVINRYARDAGVDLAALHAALSDGSAVADATEAEALGREHGIRGTPAWLFDEGLILGLRPAAEFERLADQAMHWSRE